MNEARVKNAEELYKYADHLRWAAGDLQENYHKVKAHAADFSQQWKDDSAEAFMLMLEREERVIQELIYEFTRYEGAVRKRADMVREYVARGKRYKV
jgi:hypothetical protein